MKIIKFNRLSRRQVYNTIFRKGYVVSNPSNFKVYSEILMVIRGIRVVFAWRNVE